MSVRIGEVGTTEPALLYSSAAAEDPPTATHQGNQYTVRGTGLGTTAGDPNRPVNTAFDIDVHARSRDGHSQRTLSPRAVPGNTG